MKRHSETDHSKLNRALVMETSPGLEFLEKEIYHQSPSNLWNEARRSSGETEFEPEDYWRAAIRTANVILENRPKLIHALNANVLDPSIERQVILQEGLTDFEIPILNFNAFCFVANSVPLEGTDEIEVPFQPLQTGAVNSWDQSVGYAANLMANAAAQAKTVHVGGDGNNSGANAPANTVRDRKWIGLAISSYEARRQPGLNRLANVRQAANKLGVAIFTDVISRMVNAASFGAATLTKDAVAFNSGDVADLADTATSLKWPLLQRSLVLDHHYCTAAMKDPGFAAYLANGFTDPETRQRGQQLYGWGDIYPINAFTSYGPVGEKLAGFIAHKSAACIATSPIMPSGAVAKLLLSYDVIINPKTGLAFEYRRGGSASLDQSYETIECSYGGILGIPASLKRICSQT